MDFIHANGAPHLVFSRVGSESGLKVGDHRGGVPNVREGESTAGRVSASSGSVSASSKCICSLSASSRVSSAASEHTDIYRVKDTPCSFPDVS